MPPKQEFPPLLAEGFHPRTVEQLHELCVKGFPLSTKRPLLMFRLRTLVSRLVGDGIAGDLWVDGSFLTQKIEPRDVDIVLEVAEAFLTAASASQSATLNWLGDAKNEKELKRDYSCHAFVFCDVPASHPWYPGFNIREYWIKQFGLDRRNNPKGIVVLALNGGAR